MKGWSVAALSCSVFLAGCAVMGRQQVDRRVAPESVARLQEGMTKQAVTELLGAPSEVLYVRQANDPVREHAYVYHHATTKYTGIVFAFLNFGNVEEQYDRVVVFFDESGRVSHFGASLQADTASYGFPFGR